MKPLALVLSAIMAFAVWAIAAGCGGDGELSLEEYFTQVGAIGDHLNAEATAVGEPEVNEDDVLDEREKASVLENFDAQIQVLRDFVEGLRGIEPPREAEDAHNEAVAAFQAEVDFWKGLVPQFEAVGSRAELEELGSSLYEGPEAAAVFDRVARACSAGQAVADENGIDLDLGCRE